MKNRIQFASLNKSGTKSLDDAKKKKKKKKKKKDELKGNR